MIMFRPFCDGRYLCIADPQHMTCSVTLVDCLHALQEVSSDLWAVNHIILFPLICEQ